MSNGKENWQVWQSGSPGLANKTALFFLRLYKLGLSPFLPRACRFEPSCSVYAMGCYARFGFWRAGWYALRRMFKCHPWHPGGLDPVPNNFKNDMNCIQGESE